MKQTLQLKIGHQLTMTPQLQQAIRLLQLSSMELSLEVQQALESNMMLELAEDSDREAEELSADAMTDVDSSDDADMRLDAQDFDDAEEFTNSTSEDIPSDLPVDTEWDEIYDTHLPVTQSVASNANSDYFQSRSSEETLEDRLLWQINLLHLSATDRHIALVIIDALDEDGYLTADIVDLCEAINREVDEQTEPDEVEAVLKHVQSLEPAGVAARDLGECLCLQLRQLNPGTPYLDIATQICNSQLDVLGARDFNALMRHLKISADVLKEAIALIQSLNPKPGAEFAENSTEYVIPDVFVRKHKGRWKVELNPESVPAVRVNTQYAAMIRRADSSPENSSLKSHLQEAKWFIKSLQSRSETLLRVAAAIVERQQAFLEHGEEAMKPLILHDIAEALELHESTISRVTTRKYMHTPRGIFELKYFFSSHVSTAFGGEASSTAIRAVIKKMIAEEDAVKPLSDNKIATLLSQQGIKVARRTIAKYREAMQIPPSNERKVLA